MLGEYRPAGLLAPSWRGRTDGMEHSSWASGSVWHQGRRCRLFVYFDAENLSAEAESGEEARLRARCGQLGLKLDVKNEARVHLWYEEKFGYPIPPYQSTTAVIATFPNTATTIGVRRYSGQFECCASLGLDDLFDLIVRPNKVQITPAIYDAKVARWRAEWPQLTFLTWNECSS
jgi:hypothetical protein